MPTLEHNAIVEMFRENPELAPHLLASLLRADVPSHASVEVVESSLDQVSPIEFRADLVLELLDENGRPVFVIVLEMQRDEDEDKKYAWPVYVTVVRARKRCQAVLLVLTTDEKVAAWAAETIDVGLGLTVAQPMVLGPAVVPEVTDPTVAEKETELAILSAVAHGNGPNGLAVVTAALSALWRLDQEHAAAYFQIIYNALREPMQRALEALVMEREVEGKAGVPLFAQLLIDRGELNGELRGRAAEAARAVLTVLRVRGIALPDAAREHILAQKD